MSEALKLKATLDIVKTVEVEFRKGSGGRWDWKTAGDESDIYFDTLEEAVENARKNA